MGLGRVKIGVFAEKGSDSGSFMGFGGYFN
jgi:hypothetical protein